MDRSKKVHVTGYPNYIQQMELAKVFSKYGPVTIEKFNNKYTILMFAHESEALEAIRNSGKVNVYGEFMTVTALGGQVEPAKSKKLAPNKDKGPLVEPFQLELSGDFHAQLAALLAAVRLSQGAVARLGALYQDLAAALQAHWPGCMAIPFGSITTGLGVKGSDADCFIHIPPEQRQNHGSLVNRAKRILQQQPRTFADVFSIPRANTPIVKFVHVPTGFHCDITFKTPLGTQNSRLIAFLLQSDPRLTPMAVVIKYWARVNGFSGTGKLTNYALTMLVIFYLQQAPVSILPPVELLQRDPETEIIVDGWNAGFSDDYDRLPESTNTSSISELLGGFFQYYSTFNFAGDIVCPFLGVPVKKELFKDLSLLPSEFNRYADNVRDQESTPLRVTTPICVQDPFEHSHNVSSMITSRMYTEIIAFFKFAAAAYDREKLNGCNKLLRTILLEKPKILREKLHLEFRSVIVPHIMRKVENPDWMSVVREVTVKIFKQICKIKLEKIDESPIEGSKKLKDKYMCVLTKAIWKRKQFSKLYNMMKLNFLDKQTRITEEILNVEKQIYDIQFRLMLTFKAETRHTTIVIKLIEGDPVVFREFGKFFGSVILNWYFVLLKDYSRSDEVSISTVSNETEPKVDHDVSYISPVNNEAESKVDHDVSYISPVNNEAEPKADNDVSYISPVNNETEPKVNYISPVNNEAEPKVDHDVSYISPVNNETEPKVDHDVSYISPVNNETEPKVDRDVSASVSETDDCNANVKDDAQATESNTID
ncbi:poly(A) RNA polymerase, mitochondrial-like [Melitaea cinxia]|uniref:poly(A) RNA polymerase, mitochondrial-like n=1 Tax=Melitaea cinxia TaxID=113334 RepID=UPI001E273749|nr:poly(A) RNA polymerase, mitochondrial-like [Melitaea cinxia]